MAKIIKMYAIWLHIKKGIYIVRNVIKMKDVEELII